MKCNKCGSSKNLKELFSSTTYYKEIDESQIDEKDMSYYMHRKYINEESIDELCNDYRYVNVTREVKGNLCLTCNELNVIDKKSYCDESCDFLGKNYEVLYPTNTMIEKYKEDIKKIPEEIYDLYIRAREADNKNKDVSLFLLRKTIEVLLKNLDIDGKNLYKKIENLKDSLDKDKIKEGLNRVREEGNKAVHQASINLSESEIINLADNVELILKIFYTL